MLEALKAAYLCLQITQEICIKMETRIFKIDEKKTEIKVFQKLLFAVEIDLMFS